MERKLLYYNPNILSQYRELPGIEFFSSFFKIFNPTVVFIDRTNTISIPILTKSLFPIPQFKKSSKTFEELCGERARELLNRAELLNVPLYVLWSGGIDSTLALISFLKQASPRQAKRLTVLLSEESITENRNFYQDHIRGKLNVRSSVMFPQILGTPCLFVTGEHNDQLFGSDKVGELINQFGPSVVHQLYSRDLFYKFFSTKIEDGEVNNFYLDLFERLASAAPIPIETNFEFLWWINFSVKWQSVFLRALMYTTPRNIKNITGEYMQNNYVTFYGTDDFQLWSLNNRDKKIRDSWSTYKWPCKDLIYDYTGDLIYRDTKVKKGSLYHILLQQIQYNFLDSEMNFFEQLDLSMYYNERNDFYGFSTRT